MSDIAYDYASGAGGSGASVSCPHTVSGSQSCLLAAVVGSPSDQLVDVSFGGVPLFLIDKQQEPGTSRWQYYYLTNSPASGAHTLAATFSDAQDFNAILGVSYSGVNAGQPHAAVKNTHNATGGTESLTTSVDGCWVVNFVWNGGVAITSVAVDENPATERIAGWIYDAGPIATASTFDVTTTFESSASFATMALALDPFTGTDGDGSYTEDFAGSAADLTTPWVQWQTSQPIRRNGSGASVPTNSSQLSGAIYSATTSPDQYSQIQVSWAPNVSKVAILFVRASNGSDSFTDGSAYMFAANGVTDNGIYVYESGEASYVTVVSVPAFTWSSGDVLKLQVVGTTLRLYVNGVINSNFTVTNGTLSSGFTGYGQYSGTSDTLDNWAGGDDTFTGTFNVSWVLGSNQ